MVRVLMGRVNRPINASTVLLASEFTALGTPSQFTRASVANYTNQWGVLTQAAVNAARFNYSQYSGENLVTNPRMEPVSTGAAVNQIFSSSNVTGWAMSYATGLTFNVVGKGTMSNGAPYVDVRLFGVNTSATTLLAQWYPNGFSFTPAIQGDVFTVSGYFQVIAGTIPSNSGNFISPGFDERTGGAHFSYNFGTTGINTTISTAMQRITRAVTVLQPAIDQIQPGWWINCNTTVSDVDVTIRFGGPQVEKAATASVLSLPAPGTFAASINYTGGTGNRLLIEAARTNGIRNPRIENAIAGTPGTNPLNWFVSIPGGITQTIAIGTEYGLPYIDYAFAGTATTSQAITIGFDSSTAIAALTGQTWTASLYTKLVSGGFGALTTRFTIAENDAGGAFVAGATYALTNPASFARGVATRTLSGGGTVANVQLSWSTTTIAVSDVINFTARMYGPQLEQGNQPTSLILPTAGVPAASTRAVDQWDIPASSILKTAGTVSNLALQSQTIDDATWAKTRTTVTANAIAAPDAVVTADKVVVDATLASTHFTGQINIPVVAGTTYTFSVFAKAAEYSAVRLSMSSVGFPASTLANFDLTGSGATTVSGGASSYIIPLSSGWYRCVITQTANASTALSSYTAALLLTYGGSQSFDGDGVSGIYLWGAQWETGSYATAYATTTATASTPRTKLAAGTILVRSQIPYLPVGTDVFGMFFIHSGSTTNRLAMRYHPASINVVLASNNVNIPTGIVMNSAPVANTGYIAAASWDDTGVLACVNGGTVFSTAMPMPTGNTTLTIGQASPGLTVLNGEVRRVSYHPYKMTAAQLQAATV